MKKPFADVPASRLENPTSRPHHDSYQRLTFLLIPGGPIVLLYACCHSFTHSQAMELSRVFTRCYEIMVIRLPCTTLCTVGGT